MPFATAEASAATIQRGRKSMKVKIGSAPDSWGVWFPDDPRQTPWQRFLDEISEAGYEWTELGPYGYLPSDLKTLRAELERRGLKVTGSFVMGDLANPAASWPEIERQLRGWGPILKDLAAGFLV
jgi:inosose dehydratase